MGEGSRRGGGVFAAVSIGLLLILLAGGSGGIGEHAALHMVRFALVWIACLALVVLCPRRLSSTGTVLVLALLARAALFPMAPSDDTHRYLWEGRLLTESINPYRHAPNDPILAPLAQTDPYHADINHPDLPAAYPPFSLVIFAGIGALAYHPWAMKVAMVGFDLAGLGLILQLLRFRKLDPRWALLYALNPVVLFAFAGEGHFDAIQNFFLLAALVAFDRRRWGWMFLAAGLAVQSKYVSLAAIPFLLRRDNLKWAWVGALAALLPFVPFLLDDPSSLFYCIREFGEKFNYNGSVHALLLALFGNLESATGLCKIALMIGLPTVFFLYSPLLHRRFKNDPVTGMLAAWSVLLVFAPTVHFWYITWLIPLLPLRPLRAWLLLSLTVCVVFITNGIWYHSGIWELPPAAQMLEWIPVLFVLLYEAAAGLRHYRVQYEPPPETFSIVIPALNEGEGIARCIRSVAESPSVFEVMVVDGGSQDETRQRARAAGATVLTASGGRGGQILAGIKQAQGDVVAIVHADSIVSPERLEKVLAVLQANPGVFGGAMGSVFEGRGWRLRLIEFLNDFRALFCGIDFGDQVQFFRRRSGLAHAVFHGLPLMEDVELSLRLGRLGRRAFLFGDVRVSARKWETLGYARAGLILKLVGTYLWLRLWNRVDADALYRQYYGKSNP